MKQELQDALVSLINTAVSAKDFILAEVPEVIEQLLMWKSWESIAILSIMFFFLLPIACVTYLNYREIKKDRKIGNGSLRDTTVCWAGVSSCAWVIWAIVFCSEGVPHILRLIQIQVAPKLYLIEYARSLV